MQFEWIIVGLVIIIASSGSTTCTTTNTTTSSNNNSNNNNNNSTPAAVADRDNRDIKRLWAAALQAINEAELQRQTLTKTNSPTIPYPDTAPASGLPRPNSKRLKWRPNSKLLDRRTELQLQLAAAEAEAEAEQRSGTYTSTDQDNTNPTYINVQDNILPPPTWWF